MASPTRVENWSISADDWMGSNKNAGSKPRRKFHPGELGVQRAGGKLHGSYTRVIVRTVSVPINYLLKL